MVQVLNLPSSVLLVVLFIAVCILYGFVRSASRDRKIRTLGGYSRRRVSWMLGLDILYDAMRAYAVNDVLSFWLWTFQKYGNPSNPWTVEVGGASSRLVLTADPENIKAILATQFDDFGKGEALHRQWYEFLGDGIFMVDGVKWHRSRKLIRPQFVKDRLSNLKVFERHVQILMSMLGDGETVELSNLFFRFALDAATDFLFGRSVDSLVHEQASFAYAFDRIQHIESMVTRAQIFGFLVPRRDLRQQLKLLDQFIQPFIDDALRLSTDELEKVTQSDNSYTFLHALAAHTRDRQILRDQIVSVLLAGRDTTACTLSWLFYELSLNPHVVARLRQEILQQVGPDKPPTYADLKAMRYLQHTVNEVLRLYPIVPYNGRVALQDTTIPRGGGPDGNQPVGVLKGTMVNYSTLVMQRREDLYPQPDTSFAPVYEFSPERWDRWTPKAWQYIPFNGGPRICIGQQFALAEIGYTVTRILQQVSKLSYRGGGHPGTKTDVVLAPASPVKVALYKKSTQ